jgi:protein-disulfide isomerase
MALPPKFAGHRLQFAAPEAPSPGVAPSPHVLEVYLDYVCPFSAKLFKTLTSTVAPMIRSHPTWPARLTVIFRQQVQPWHPSSTLVHEAGLAVLKVAPAKFWEFSERLFDAQKDYFDVSVVNETRNATYRRLADLAGKVDGVDAEEVYKLLAIPDKAGEDGSLNSGNGITADLKVVTKMNRLIGIHVTPTVVFDGVVQDVSSSWDGDQWKEWLTKNVV